MRYTAFRMRTVQMVISGLQNRCTSSAQHWYFIPWFFGVPHRRSCPPIGEFKDFHVIWALLFKEFSSQIPKSEKSIAWPHGRYCNGLFEEIVDSWKAKGPGKSCKFGDRSDRPNGSKWNLTKSILGTQLHDSKSSRGDCEVLIVEDCFCRKRWWATRRTFRASDLGRYRHYCRPSSSLGFAAKPPICCHQEKVAKKQQAEEEGRQKAQQDQAEERESGSVKSESLGVWEWK